MIANVSDTVVVLLEMDEAERLEFLVKWIRKLEARILELEMDDK